ncbi:hypothetical protein JX265_008718 [Neoarthrinium moseri]|uniref:Rhodopsin domain-containing protein n=1 Tax=Neoarthrinium moseri TaxID=1658444 RepID=A0A9P9WHC5_9PEZI|nr:uncharacterized protein JN550_008805 [Neoarthrinium moseri]KAI1848501.1 hypothetical protein JX266_005807 [Neoarthrinium moseri]KAI1863501.1 hypothetical protein JX265_008718 [Neoarthrinium moseri]KAI1864518.1 hypothetical protein JN550_008805 [Neoarthrinium moseri]
MAKRAMVPISDAAVANAQIFYGVMIPLLVLSTATVAIRFWRLRSRLSEWSDWCILAGYILSVADFALLLPTMVLTPGSIDEDVAINAGKYTFLAIPIWGIAMALIKTSVGLTLMRIQSAVWFTSLIWLIIGVVCAYGIGNTFFILLECRPLEAAWDPMGTPDAQCLGASAIRIASTVGAVISIVTDILLSLAPVSFLWNLNRPLRERVVIGILMGIGLLAAVSSLMKNLVVRDYGKPGIDTWAQSVTICTWVVVECFLGILAACTPFCKPALQACLGAIGVSLTTKSGHTPGYANYQRATAQDTFASRKVQRHSYTNDSDEGPLNYEMDANLRQKQRNVVLKSTEIRIHREIGGQSPDRTSQTVKSADIWGAASSSSKRVEQAAS